MQNLSDEERKAVLGEVLMDELKAIREYLVDVPVIKQKLEDVDDRLSNVEQDVKIIKAAVTDQSKQLQEYGQRLDTLEAGAV